MIQSMETNCEVKPIEKGEYFKSWRFWKPFLAVVIGAMAGYLYYHFVGCTSGQCAITSNPYSSVIGGGFLGLFFVNSFSSKEKS